MTRVILEAAGIRQISCPPTDKLTKVSNLAKETFSVNAAVTIPPAKFFANSVDVSIVRFRTDSDSEVQTPKIQNHLGTLQILDQLELSI